MNTRIPALIVGLLASTTALVGPTATPAGATASSTTYTGRVSTLAGAVESANPGDSTTPIVSGNGRFVTFTSRSRLSPIDSFEFEDVYVRDLLTDQVEMISVRPDGTQAVSPSYAGAISYDGRYVVFSSISNVLVPNDTNDRSDIFIRDRVTQTTERVSIASSGLQSTTHSPVAWSYPRGNMDVSDDGRYVAFTSGSPVFGDTPNSSSNVMVRDRQTGTTEMVSVSNTEVLPNATSYTMSMSGDGRYVAFRSNAYNLVTTDNNGSTGDIFVRDRTLGTTVLVSKTTAGNQTFEVSFDPAISDDGTKVAFISRGSLTTGDLITTDDVFLRNLTTSTTTKLSPDFLGGEADQDAEYPVISGDGTTVAWQSLSGEYISGGGNGMVHIYKRVGTNPITRESVSTAGTMGDGASNFASLSRDGKVLVFDSASTNLVGGDTGFKDIFVRRNPEVGPHGTVAAYSAAMVQHFTGAANATLASTLTTRIGRGASPERQVLLLATGAFGAKRGPLVRLYEAYFKRLPDTGGLNYWLGKLNTGTSLDQVSAQFASSNEFNTKYGNTTNSEFVILVYNNVLGRSPDGAGLNFWVSKLNTGTSRGTVMTNFSESNEGKRVFRPQVDTALTGVGLFGGIGPLKLFDAAIAYMTIDSSERGVQRLIDSSEYAATM